MRLRLHWCFRPSTLIFLIMDLVPAAWPMAYNAEVYMMNYLGLSEPLHSLGTDVPTLVALLVCLIPTTIGALLAAIRHRRDGSRSASQYHREKRQSG